MSAGEALADLRADGRREPLVLEELPDLQLNDLSGIGSQAGPPPNR